MLQAFVNRSPGLTAARRGRPAAATPEAVKSLARERYLAGDRVELTLLAGRLGLGRATIHRWFGTRDQLLGEVVADALEELLERRRAEVRLPGAAGLLEVFDRVNQSLASSRAVQRLLESERAAALRLLTSGAGIVQPRAVAAVRRLIDAEVQTGRYRPPTDTETLAYAIVRLSEAFLHNDAAIGIRGEHQRLRHIEAVLLGIPSHSSPSAPVSRPPRAPRGLRLRPLERGDEPELKRIHRTAEVSRWWGAPAPGFPWDEPESTRFTILVRGQIAGLIQYWEENQAQFRHAGIDLFLDPALHGQGWGTTAVAKVVQLLVHERGHHRVTIDPATANSAAIRAYEKAGFVAVGVMRSYERINEDDDWEDALLMELVVH